MDPLEMLTPARLRVLVALADHGSVRAAATALDRTTSSVRAIVQDIQRVSGVSRLFDSVGGRLTPTPRAVPLIRAAREIVARCEGLLRLADDTPRVLAFLPHHAGFVAPLLRRLDEPGMTRIEVLDESRRATRQFEEMVLRPLEAGAIDVVIGPPPGPSFDLARHELYRARLEAMVPADDRRSSVALAELADHRLLVPPPTFRSRQLLDDNAERAGTTLTVAHEAYVTSVLVQLGRQGLGTVVVPSDIALAYKPGGAFAGEGTAAWRWVPIVHDGEALEHPVVASTRQDPRADVRRTVELLREVVDAMPGLGGEPAPAGGPAGGAVRPAGRTRPRPPRR